MVKFYVDIERPSGTFTVHYKERQNFTAAQKECAKNGQILAPITEKEDFDAIFEVVTAENEENLITGRDWTQYMVGLEVAYDNSKKVFMNGVKFDEKKHGSFYKDDQYNRLEDGRCPLALLSTWDPTSITVENTWCETEFFDYICFEPKNKPCASAEAVVSETGFKNYDVKILFLAGTGAFALIVFAVLFVFKVFNRIKRN